MHTAKRAVPDKIPFDVADDGIEDQRNEDSGKYPSRPPPAPTKEPQQMEYSHPFASSSKQIIEENKHLS